MPADLHARVAATILAQLETANPRSWTPPWHGADPLPRNARTGRRYRGLNILALWCAARAKGYSEARWATYRQWTALGGQVRRAEQGTLVLFYKDLPRGTCTSDADPDSAAVPFVTRAAHVFNIAQVDIASTPAEAAGTPTHQALISGFDAFVAVTGAVICEGSNRACYVPATDTIHLPPRTTFHSPEGRAGTLAHELIHWTGAPHRLNRNLSGRFGVRAYAAEELVAELGAAFVLADLGLARTPHPNHAAYCASWAPLLRADPRTQPCRRAGLARSRLFGRPETGQPGCAENGGRRKHCYRTSIRGNAAFGPRETSHCHHPAGERSISPVLRHLPRPRRIAL